jgi:hypothetical protein
VQISVAIEDLFARDGGDAFAGDDNSGEVHGIGGSYWDDGGAEAVAGGAERFDGFREGVLFPTEAGEKAAAADLAACFETAEDIEEIAPAGSVRLACDDVAEEDAVAGEEHPGRRFKSLIGAAGVLDGLLGDLGFVGLGR